MVLFKVILILLISHITIPIISGLPNIVFILLDDVDIQLTGLKALNKTKSLVSDEGVTFSNAFANTPICCPSRSSMLTGQYLHNLPVTNNSVSGGCASQEWQDGPEQNTFATYLKTQGYSTFYAGKYLNCYGMNYPEQAPGGIEHVPPGWDTWAALKGNSKYYNYSLSINGREEKHGDDYNNDYLTDVIAKKSEDFLDKSDASTPFLMVLGIPAAHDPFTPAPQYMNEFNDEKAPRTPAYNYVDEPGHEKHWIVQIEPRQLDATAEEEIDRIYRDRQRTLLSVDDLVESLLNKIPDLGNTYVIFSSDHGYHFGQFGMPIEKRQPYEFDIRVPLMIRGPGIVPGTETEAVALMIDIAPTILDMAGIERPEQMDGKSLLPLLTESGSGSAEPAERQFLIEYFGEAGFHVPPACKSEVDSENMGACDFKSFSCKCADSRNNTYTCLRTLLGEEDNVFCQFEDDENFVEIYDLKIDPYQLTNLAPAVEEEFSDKKELLSHLKTCRGWKECIS